MKSKLTESSFKGLVCFSHVSSPSLFVSFWCPSGVRASSERCQPQNTHTHTQTHTGCSLEAVWFSPCRWESARWVSSGDGVDMLSGFCCWIRCGDLGGQGSDGLTARPWVNDYRAGSRRRSGAQQKGTRTFAKTKKRVEMKKSFIWKAAGQEGGVLDEDAVNLDCHGDEGNRLTSYPSYSHHSPLMFSVSYCYQTEKITLASESKYRSDPGKFWKDALIPFRKVRSRH